MTAADVVFAEVRAHDALLAALDVPIWVGAEPTFTRRESQQPWWLGEAQGGEKLERARALLCALAPRLAPTAELLRVVGRQYPGEPTPRFALGALWSRDARSPGDAPLAALRVTPHAKAGLWLSPGGFLEPPPCEPPLVDRSQAFLTITPDPGVVEVNMAPAHDLATFLGWARATYAAADDAGLSPIRFRYNGDVVDSGGGGQITLGGPTPQDSPFFARPQLLPRLLRFVNRHPSLSYWFAPECVGSASQGPRSDEGVRERFEELAVTLDRLAMRGDRATPEELGASLGPLLVDASGNSHRAEVNIEKLWSPLARGRLGLVELRALRMEPTPERMVAVAVLWRALAARLIAAPFDEPLVDWGARLHDRFALPGVLGEDLSHVLADLEAHGFGIGPALSALLCDPPPTIGSASLPGATLSVRRAVDFWPLVGDTASQEERASRVVDSSTERVEVAVAVDDSGEPGDLGVLAGAEPVVWRVPLRRVGGGSSRFVAGVRRRTFVPSPGLHPGLAPHEPLTFFWRRAGAAVSLRRHGWIPGGGVYPGLPADADEAAQRRAARVVVEQASPSFELRSAPDGRGWTFDLRRL